MMQVMEAQDEEDAEAGGETIETQGMRELAQLPQHQQVRPCLCLFVCVCFDALVSCIFLFVREFASVPQVLGIKHLGTV